MTKHNGTTPTLRDVNPDTCFIYCRVSTDEQARKGYGLDVQEEQCREYAGRNGLHVVRVFKDDYSGTTLERPAMSEMRQLLKRGGAGAVIVHRATRLSRDDVDYLVFLKEMWGLGVRPHLADKGELVKQKGVAKVLTYLDGWQGNEENDQRIKATQDGRVKKALAGKWVGNGYPPFGYAVHGKRDETRLVVDPDNGATVRQIFEWYTGAGGKQPVNLVQIAERLMAQRIPPPGKYSECGTWHAKVVRAIIDRRAYLGEFHYAGHTIPLPELAIIDVGTFERAQLQRGLNKARATRNAKRQYLLTGHFRCACGAGMMAYHSSNGHNYYACVYKRQERHLRRCSNKQIAAAKAEPVVWAWLRDLLKDDAALEAGMDRMIERSEIELSGKRERAEAVRGLITEVDRDIADYAVDLRAIKTAAGRDAIRRQIDELGKRREVLDAEAGDLAADLGQAQVSEADRAILRGVAAQLRDGLDDADYETVRYILGRLNVKAVYRVDTAGEWLDVRCEFQAENEPPIELPVLSRRETKRWLHPVVFSACLPIAPGPVKLGQPSLADELFKTTPATASLAPW